jgi:recombination protein RecT
MGTQAVAKRDAELSPAVQKRQDVRAQLERYHDSFARVLPKHITPERLTTLALVAATKTPKILDCTPESIALALVRISQWGLEIGTTAHLVPFGNVCTPIADWKGLVQLMIRSGHARDVKAKCVYEGEHFRYEEGLDAVLEHHPNALVGKRGPMVGVYAIARLRGSITTFEVMSKEEVDRVRNNAISKNSDAWNKHYDEMAKKTVIRRLAKRIPQAATLEEAISYDDDPKRAMEAFAKVVGVPMDAQDAPGSHKLLGGASDYQYEGSDIRDEPRREMQDTDDGYREDLGLDDKKPQAPNALAQP